MTDGFGKLNEQALVAVIAALDDLNIDVAEVLERADVLLRAEGSRILLVDNSRIENVALATSLAVRAAKMASAP